MLTSTERKLVGIGGVLSAALVYGVLRLIEVKPGFALVCGIAVGMYALHKIAKFFLRA